MRPLPPLSLLLVFSLPLLSLPHLPLDLSLLLLSLAPIELHLPAGPDRFLRCIPLKSALWHPKPGSRLRARWWNWTVMRYGSPFIVQKFQSGGFTSLHLLMLGWRIIVSKTRGNTGIIYDISCVNSTMTPWTADWIHLENMCSPNLLRASR